MNEPSFISLVICLRSRPRDSSIMKLSPLRCSFSLRCCQTGPSLSSTRSRSFLLKDTGEISPRPSYLTRGAPSESGSPFGFELITSRTSSPVPLLRKSLAILLSSLIIFVFSCGLAGNAGHVSQIKFRFFYRTQSLRQRRFV